MSTRWRSQATSATRTRLGGVPRPQRRGMRTGHGSHREIAADVGPDLLRLQRGSLVSAVAFLFYILVVRRGTAGTGLDLRFMPAVNASLNALSACLLIPGWVAIRRKAVQLHRYCQVSAFVSSSLFLIGYLAYHFVHGDTKFLGRRPG